MADDVCALLTLEELAALLDAGWAVVSGPHDTEAACLAHCAGTGTGTVGTGTGTGTGTGAGGVTTDCCPGHAIPAGLWATVTGGGGITGSFPLAHRAGPPADPDQWHYDGSLGTCGAHTDQLQFHCVSGVWTLTIGVDAVAATSVDCVAPTITFTGVDLSGCGGSGSATVTVTP